jgi:hypothetical protein
MRSPLILLTQRCDEIGAVRGSRRSFLLGTIWGPHVLRGNEQTARRSVTRTLHVSGLTSGDAYPYVLGVKGSQVQILSSRRSRKLAGSG